jgi:hypothetical protein
MQLKLKNKKKQANKQTNKNTEAKQPPENNNAFY